MYFLTLLPEELLELLITYLDGLSTHYLGSSCSLLHSLTSQPKVWKRLLRRTGIVTITREVEKLAKGDLRAIYFLSHRLRKNWGSGLVKEAEVWRQPSRMLYGPMLQRFDASEAKAALVSVRPDDFDISLEVFDLIEGVDEKWLDHETEYLSIGAIHGDALNLPGKKIVEEVFVLDSFIVVLPSDREANQFNRLPPYTVTNMMVFSIEERKFLYTQKAVLDLRGFMRGVSMDIACVKDYVVAFKIKHIDLCHVTNDRIVVRVLEVEEGARGVFQYCKFMTWDEVHMAYPFQGHPADPRQPNAEVEHQIYCWDQATWEKKIFRIIGKVNDIQHSLSLHNGKLFAAQSSVVRIWDLGSGILEKVSSLPGLYPHSFLITEGIGVHLHPSTQLLVGIVSTTLQVQSALFTSNIPIYSVKVLSMEGELVASLDIPEEKDKRQIRTQMVGPRLVIFYNDNSYSVVDLELEALKCRNFPNQHQREILKVFPLGSAYKKGTLVSDRSLVTSSDPNVFSMRNWSNVSQMNIVISHSDKYPTPMDYLSTFSFL